MACMTTSSTWCPSSYQIRFAFKSHHSILVRRKFLRRKQPRCQLHMLSISRNSGNGLKWRTMSLDSSSASDFSGWSNSDADDENSADSNQKQDLQTIIKAGLAGIIFVAGLTFAALLSKRNISRTIPLMEPLTTQQELSLENDTENDRFKDEENETKELVQDVSTMISDNGKDNDSFSPMELNEATTENKSSDDTGNGTSSFNNLDNDIEAVDNASVEENLQDESASDDTSFAPNMSSVTLGLSDSEIVGASSIAETKSSSVIKESLVGAEPTQSFDSDSNPTSLSTDNSEEITGSNETSQDFSTSSSVHIPNEPVDLSIAESSELDAILDYEPVCENVIESVSSTPVEENLDLLQDSVKELLIQAHGLTEIVSSGSMSVSALADTSVNEQDANFHNGSKTTFESPVSGDSFSSAGIPAPSAVSAAQQVRPGKVLVPAAVDQFQGQALAALQVLKVIESNVQPSDLCTRREYARWLVSASSALSKSTSSKVYPAMYIENVTDLAFDDITPEDPDFSSIQGLAEAGLISSKLSRRDLLPLDEDESPLFFHPESSLSRQDLVCWKMALEKRELQEADKKTLYQLSGFIDIDKINPDAWPALIADMSAGEQGIIALSFGYTRLFQPMKPVTTSQAAIALSTGEASDMVSEELARIEAEAMAENVVAAHSALVAQVENDINANFEKELLLEREKINAVEKMAEEAKQELEKLRAQKEEDTIILMKERAVVESEMESLSKLKGEIEVQLQTVMGNKIELSYEKDRISKLRNEAEIENKEISRLQYELEVERKALAMARSWAEDEAKRAREQAKFLEEARDRWERHGIKVIVDSELQEDATSAGGTWSNAVDNNQFSVEKTVTRSENLVDNLKIMGNDVRGKSKELIENIIKKILYLISKLRERVSEAGRKTGEFTNVILTKTRASVHKFKQTTVELKDTAILKAKESTEDLQQKSSEFSFALTEGVKRVAGDCKDGVDKLTQKFKA